MITIFSKTSSSLGENILKIITSVPGYDGVDGDGEDHDGDPGEDGGAQLHVHEVAAERDLQGGRPGVNLMIFF
jgi:hypothetical protein